MLKESISEKAIKWILTPDLNVKRVVVLIPQYNELSHGNFIQRLHYFNELAKLHTKTLDLIIIDDGSTDNSLQAIEEFIEKNSVSFGAVSVTPNANKIGALYLTILNIDYDYVLFSDFDTDLVNLEYLSETLKTLDNSCIMMGCYFRMIPADGASIIVRYQKLEYAISRIWYKYISIDRSVPVMPGAGSLYKHEMLLKILESHSGRRNGEDRETTIIGLKLGYEVFYQNKILAVTRTPDTIKKLILQRARWDLGYLETFSKEKGLYVKQIISLRRLGLRSFFDLLNNILLLTLPFVIILVAFFSLRISLIMLVSCYLLKLVWVRLMLQKEKSEVDKINSYPVILVLYPLFKVLSELPAWIKAIFTFVSSNYRSTRSKGSIGNLNSNGLAQKNGTSSWRSKKTNFTLRLLKSKK